MLTNPPGQGWEGHAPTSCDGHVVGVDLLLDQSTWCPDYNKDKLTSSIFFKVKSSTQMKHIEKFNTILPQVAKKVKLSDYTQQTLISSKIVFMI